MPNVCFTPIWYPADQYATSRLRAKYVVELLAGDALWNVELGYDSTADLAVIVQLCSDRNFDLISRNRRQLVIYDVCDRYFATDNTFKTDEGELHATRRCLQVIDRADVLIAPSKQLTDELSRSFPQKTCLYIPELVDYRSQPRPVTPPGSRRLLWFGHTTRGNFDSARWIIDHLSSRYEYRPVLVTAPASMKHRYPTYAPYCVPWSIETLTREMAQAELCVVSHAPEEPTKSPNRFVTATIRGVPTIVSNSPSCFEILQAAGHGEFAVAKPSDVDRALALLSNPERRHSYVYDLQREMWRRHGPHTVRQAYIDLFDKVLPSNSDY